MTSESNGRGKVLWRPAVPPDPTSPMSKYVRWLSAEHGIDFEDYDSLWRWSIADIAGFWGSLADFLQVKFVDKPST